MSISTAVSENDGIVSEQHAKFICQVFNPLPSHTAQSRVNSSHQSRLMSLDTPNLIRNNGPKLVIKSDPRLCVATEVASSQYIVDEYASMAPHSFFTSLSTLSNLPTMSLFMAQSVAESNSGDYFPRFFTSPDLNIRQLPLTRVTSSGPSFSPAKARKRQTPLLDSLVSGDAATDLCSISIAVFPYQFHHCQSRNGNREERQAAITCIFAEVDVQVDPASYMDAAYVTIEEARNLLSMLAGIPYEEYCVEQDDFVPSCLGGDKISILLDLSLQLLQERYDGLSSVEGWHRLYSHLMHHMNLQSRQSWGELQHPSSFHNLVSRTITLFQAMTPIRLAFVDGQCRVASTSFYIRNIVANVSLTHTLEPLQVWQMEPNGLAGSRTNGYPVSATVPPTGFFDIISKNLPVSIKSPMTGTQSGVLEDHVVSLFKHLSDSILKSIQKAAPMSLHDVLKLVLGSDMKSSLADWNDDTHILEATRQKRYWICEKILSYKCQSIDNMITELLSSPNLGCLCPRPSSVRKQSKQTNLSRSSKKPEISEADAEWATLDQEGNPVSFDLTKNEGIARSLFHGKKGRLRSDGIPTSPTTYPKPGELVVLTVLAAHSTPDNESIDLLRNCISNNWLGSYSNVFDLASRLLGLGPKMAEDFVDGTFKSSQGRETSDEIPRLSSMPKVSTLSSQIITRPA